MAGALAAFAVALRTWAVAGGLLLVALGLLFDAVHWMRLAARSSVGARGACQAR